MKCAPEGARFGLGVVIRTLLNIPQNLKKGAISIHSKVLMLAIDAETLLSKLEGMKGSAIIKKDGTIAASRLPGGVDAKELSKKALAMMESARLYAERTGSSQASYAVVGASEGLIAVAQNSGYIIVCIMGPESDSDSAAGKIKKAAESLRELA